MENVEHHPSKPVQENFVAANTSSTSHKDNSDCSFLTDSTQSNSSVYDSAVENLSAFKSFDSNACANNNTNAYKNITNFDLTSSEYLNSSSDNTLNENTSGVDDSEMSAFMDLNRSAKVPNVNNNAQASLKLIQSESTDTNTSQEEVDPKSQLANKTIFKTDNPNLSIIEISDGDDMHRKNAELENSVVLVIEEPLSDDVKGGATRDAEKRTPTSARKSPGSISSTSSNRSSSSSGVSSANHSSLSTDISAATDKRRKKVESFIQTSKQKLNVSIAEAAAAGGGDNVSVSTAQSIVTNSTDTNPETRREIQIYETIEEFEQNLPSTVTILDTPFGSKVYLVGTAHFSEESQDDVSFVIRNVRPDVVMVELCPSRVHILKLDERTLLEEAKHLNLSKIRGIIQAHGYINGIFFIMLLQMNAQIAKDLGMAPGGEFRRAFEEVQRLPGCMLHLGDRPIRVTLHRALRALSFWQTIKMVVRLLNNDTISIEEVEECKQRDLLEKLMEEMAGEFPAFSDVFVAERDMFLCHSLQLAALPQATPNGLPRPVRVVGVVGIGHANGIAKLWGRVNPLKIPEIMEIPPARLSTRICTFTLKYGIVGLALFGAYRILRPRLTGLF